MPFQRAAAKRAQMKQPRMSKASALLPTAQNVFVRGIFSGMPPMIVNLHASLAKDIPGRVLSAQK